MHAGILAFLCALAAVSLQLDAVGLKKLKKPLKVTHAPTTHAVLQVESSPHMTC